MMATLPASEAFHHDPMLGKAVGGRYVIERLVGRGGVGLVYLAHDRAHDRAAADAQERQVVVKVLAPHWAEDPDAVARFGREALRMAKLDHPNVVKMYDHGHFEGRAYIVMEFIRGEPLRRYLDRRKRLPLEEFVPIASQILLGAGYVHERGIMMRDIKPPNIMLCEHAGKANHVKLLDFGLAKLIEDDEEDEVTKAHVIGTAAYMSPEQIRGEAIDVRVDVYALGVLFFLMLTGEQPISGDNDAAVLVNHVHGKPKSLAERLPKGHRVPPKLIELIESCLAKDPGDRPSDASAMAEALFEIVPAPLLAQPQATLKTRAAAETYWATRMHSGPAALAALESDTSDSAEWTRPLLRRAAKTGQAPLQLAEAEIAAQRQKVQAVPKPRPRTTSGTSGGSGMRPRPRSPTGSGLKPRPANLGPPPAPPPRRPTSGPTPLRPSTSGSSPSGSSPSGSSPSTSIDQRPSSATIRVTAADAREAVERLEHELEDKRERGATIPPLAPPLAPPRAPVEALDVVPISFDDDSEPPTFDAAAPTEPSELVAELMADAAGTGSVRVMASGSFPPPQTDGMRLGALVAVAGLVALVLGGISAYLVLGGTDDPAPPSAALSDPAGESNPASTHPTMGGSAVGAAMGAAADRSAGEAVDVGRVQVRANAEASGARVEVDGEDRGEAPVRLELPLGEHRVRVTAPSHHPWQTTIVVQAEANADVTAELVAAEAPVVPLPTPAPAAKDPKRRKPSGSSSSKPKRDATAEPKPKPKVDPFMNSSKPKDDGIFLPVGGK